MNKEYTALEKQEFWEGIDLAPLNEHLSKQLGIKVNLVKQMLEKPNQTYYSLEDKTNIAEQNAIIHAAWKEMKVGCFGCRVNVDEKTGELMLWAKIDLAYKHWDYGENGAEIARAWYTANTWTIKTEEENASR